MSQRRSRYLCFSFGTIDLELHADFLCKEWDCTDEVKELVLDKMREDAERDIVRPQ